MTEPFVLEDEGRGWRRYGFPDGTHLEVRPQMYGRTAETGAENVDGFPEIGQHVVRMLTESITEWAKLQGVELLPFIDTRSERVTHQVYKTDENDDLLLDEDGEPIPTGETYENIRYTVEVGYWPFPSYRGGE